MSDAAQPLLPEIRAPAKITTGILPSQQLQDLIRRKLVFGENPIELDQVQPASIDLRLGDFGYRVRASFLPGKEATVQDKIDEFAAQKFEIGDGTVLEKDCVYVVKLTESLELTKDLSGTVNPKSSIGRLDIFTRLITDYSAKFDRIQAGYSGPLYAEISPLAFSIVVRKGSRLNQLRLQRGSPQLAGTENRKLFQQLREPYGETFVEEAYRRGFPISVNLRGTGSSRVIGYKARNHAPPIDVDERNHYDVSEFWELICATNEAGIILDPNDFYILASKEGVSVPPEFAAEMVAYDTLVGEFRVHYAGFFDPGFGYAPHGHGGTRAVLEVRSHEVPFLIEDGQIVGRLMYEKLAATPDKLYGSDIGSSYQRQGLALSKHFRQG